MPATCSRNARAWKPNRSPTPKRDAGEVHRQATLEVGVGRADEHLAVAVEAVVAQLGG